MRLSLLDLLRCPYCGTSVSLVDNGALVRDGEAIEAGVLGCQCCAFPIVAGIPVMIASDRVREAMHRLESGDGEGALHVLLDLRGARVDAFRAFDTAPESTYREGLGILSHDAEAEYFVYRFSDPTFRVARALVQATGTLARRPGWYIDICGGSGHLVRSMVSDRPPVLADVQFWKLWLARHRAGAHEDPLFVAPQCEPVCCDANSPLPFARGAFSLVALSDAFPYIWHKRLLADEMMRLAGTEGVIVMPHLHSALGENVAAGMPLTPGGYADLLAPHQPRLYRESTLLDGVLRGALDLAACEPADALAGEAALAIVASRDEEVFRTVTLPVTAVSPDRAIVNPLYQIAVAAGSSVLTLTFPTHAYAEEFAAAGRYLPATVVVPGDLTRGIDVRTLGQERYDALCRQMVLLDAPPRYV